ncbi:hypothetical protein, partial [Streptomyces sp. NPDC051546]|uniref:hypothetical protein n=1 Tax=Streptomyces sp. NPDC051546 TaxID=3365655 RepID=UPI003790A6EC
HTGRVRTPTEHDTYAVARRMKPGVHFPGSTSSVTSLTIEGTAPTAVASAAMRSLLPRIDHHLNSWPGLRQRQVRRQHLSEIKALLRARDIAVREFNRPGDIIGLSWQHGDTTMTVTLHALSATGTLSLRGNLAALERVIVPFLPPCPGPGRVRSRPPHGCGGVARRLLASFPHAVEADQDGLVRFADTDGGPLQGWVMPRTVNSPASPLTPVTAGICGAGIDLMLSALSTIA